MSEKRAKSKTTVEKNLYKILTNLTYGKFVETKLKWMKVSSSPHGMNARLSFRSTDMI